MKSIYVGIDISKDTLDFCIKGNENLSSHKIKNKVTAIQKLLKTIAELDPEAFICMENTGYYNFNLYEALEKFSFKTYVVDPKHIKRSIGLVRGKNDKVDANRLIYLVPFDQITMEEGLYEQNASYNLNLNATKPKLNFRD